jgi:hypothetical protein
MHSQASIDDSVRTAGKGPKGVSKDAKDPAKDPAKAAKRSTKQRPAARPYKKVPHSVLVDRIGTMQKQLHVMGCKTALLQHRLTNYEKEQQQRDDGSE